MNKQRFVVEKKRNMKKEFDERYDMIATTSSKSLFIGVVVARAQVSELFPVLFSHVVFHLCQHSPEEFVVGLVLE